MSRNVERAKLSSEYKSDDRFSSIYIDLLSERLGGRAIACSDEWFAGAENMLKPGRGVFKEGLFVSTGKWMDGWESRRSFGRNNRSRQGEDFDWCILRMGSQGVLKGLDIDTNHFHGNAPEHVAVEASMVSGHDTKGADWQEVLKKTAVRPHSQNLFSIESSRTWNHLRLKIFPDGGVARFRAYGRALHAKEDYVAGELVDLASALNGGIAVDASDRFFSSPTNLVMPGRGINMGDGWETKRRRNEQNDWAIIRLGMIGDIRKVIIDTAHFRGNFPDSASLQGAIVEKDSEPDEKTKWTDILDRTRLTADYEHIFTSSLKSVPGQIFSHVRLQIYPDGGVSRLRVFGLPES